MPEGCVFGPVAWDPGDCAMAIGEVSADGRAVSRRKHGAETAADVTPYCSTWIAMSGVSTPLG